MFINAFAVTSSLFFLKMYIKIDKERKMRFRKKKKKILFNASTSRESLEYM